MAKTKAVPNPRTKKMGRVARDILHGLDEIRRHLRGEESGVIVYPPDAPPATVRAIAALKAAREKAGLSAADVAAAVGVPATRITRLEAGKVKNPTVDVLERYARAVGRELRLRLAPAK